MLANKTAMSVARCRDSLSGSPKRILGGREGLSLTSSTPYMSLPRVNAQDTAGKALIERAKWLQGAHDHGGSDHGQEAGHHRVGQIPQRGHDPRREPSTGPEDHPQQKGMQVQRHEGCGVAGLGQV